MAKYKKGKYLEGLFTDVAIDMMGNNQEMKVFISMAPPHENNKKAKGRQVNISMNIKGKLMTVQFPLLTFIRTHSTYTLQRKVLFEKYKPTVPADFSKILNSFDQFIGLDHIVEEYGWKTKSNLIKHMVEQWEKEGRAKAQKEEIERKRRTEEALRNDRYRGRPSAYLLE